MATRPAAVRTGSRIRQIGWALVLGLCVAIFLALTFKVNAVKSEVRLTERQIIAMEREALMLETEFQTRSSQRQLAAWNAVEFGFVAPSARHFLESERQLAALGLPRGLNAPDPIRVARSEPVVEEEGLFAEWVSPVAAAELTSEASGGETALAADLSAKGGSLAQRLARSSTVSSGLSDAGQ
ncbi:hypothetical protein A9995_08040 [Erythrobacter sp. QSSC1-22B]|uniref:hypothetical protein n=1 Tax=Erythrobacter sp. QSSC1-22B TaxID=1860125 RepID=UPI0008056BC7|nr:hypothetical protein [Erythrobacter sp. QSSC1-22B]OBX19086.1 hypothetical protein A9995_08040 [Erythrobacter sp. QSSC1-22B]